MIQVEVPLHISNIITKDCKLFLKLLYRQLENLLLKSLKRHLRRNKKYKCLSKLLSIELLQHLQVLPQVC